MNNVELGKAVGLSHVAIGNFLKGQLPKSEYLIALADFFNVTTDWILGRDAESEPATLREGEDPNKEIQNWRKRAKRAEQELADLRSGLRSLLEKKTNSSTADRLVGEVLEGAKEKESKGKTG